MIDEAAGRLTRASAGRRQVADLRPDIQALRAIAVGSVLLFHLWPARLTGGYVGVDVFFVISGFLITAHLLREVEATGRVRVGAFWARRARRLLPSSLGVLAVTAIAAALVLPLAQWRGTMADIMAAAVYSENWRLAWLSVDYLGSQAAPSPVQHYWTLSVEEQFYIALPLLLMAILWVARRRSWPWRRAVAITLVAVVAVSLALSVVLTPWTAAAYFMTHVRAWEFGVGALVALVPLASRGKPWFTMVGVAAILASTLVLTEETPFPGYAAVLPVAGAAIALWAGSGTWLTRAGAWWPVAQVGRASYAIYLWHWPAIVLWPFVAGHELVWREKVVLGAASVIVGWVTTVAWEEPVRFSERLLGGRRPRVVAAWSAGASLAVVLIAGGLYQGPGLVESQRAAEVAREMERLDAEGCLGAASMTNPECDPLATPALFIPMLSMLADDDANDAECWGFSDDDERPRMCDVGSGDGPLFLVLGDSHSNGLLSAYEILAEERGWRFRVSGMGGCYVTAAEIARGTEEQQSSCHRWRELALAEIAAGGYDALIVTHASRSSVVAPEGVDQLEAKIQGLVGAWQQRPDLAVPVIAVVDNPNVGDRVGSCLARTGIGGGVECGAPREDALWPDPHAAAAQLADNAYAVNLHDLFCTSEVCPAIVGGVVVYRPDGHHLSATFVDTLAPMLGDAIADAFEESTGRSIDER